MSKTIKSFDEFMNEGVMPEWAKPTSDLTSGVRKDNYQEHQDPSQSMTRFNIGDKIVEVETGVSGTITSMGDGLDTITWKCESGQRHDSYPKQLELVSEQTEPSK